MLWLTDKKGRDVAIPVSKVAYIELSSATADRPLASAARAAGPRQSGESAPMLDRRLLFVTGKGGVGKTSVAAALGARGRGAGQAHAFV